MPSPTTPSTSPTSTYAPRQTTFHLNPHHIDEKILTHDHHILPHYDAPNPSTRERFKITHRDLSNLSLLAHVTRVQYGYFHDDPACLLGLKFQFQSGGGGSHHAWRFERADIRIQFEGRDGEGEDPVVVDYGPKRLVSNGTDERRDWWCSATLSATASTPVAITPSASASLSAGQTSSYTHHTATEISGAEFTDHAHSEPTIVKFWLREDERQKSRIPLEFACAVVVKYAGGGGPFQATVDVKVGPVFDLLATPWGPESPVVLEPGVEFGEGVGLGQGQVVDFARLGAEEWRDLVAPDWGVSEMLSDSPHSGK
ncbi:hypothetical protein M409DRAFT_57027 [Zasmidium cellare ATCC 36951]|uniref:Uncharacterized protein n=1 Tax=Zasmidium cellare ATCC 36951 TaxID=1080233 RepID=A0A6A6CER3_ZASCE|nr:uncharacterized protein M409DRAFT_57027 [Zasmidium cellare ATCC 36951]KAF2163916.1 hypothetical protein M409DRAFT_57027 [Zasmidium cellare ATCC 36951]